MTREQADIYGSARLKIRGKKIVTFLQKIQDWLLGGYEAEKSFASRMIVGRLTRGNVSVQVGDEDCMDKEELDVLSKAGDKAMERLRRRLNYAN